MPGPRGYPHGVGRGFAARAAQMEPFLAMEVMERALVLERDDGSRVGVVAGSVRLA